MWGWSQCSHTARRESKAEPQLSSVWQTIKYQRLRGSTFVADNIMQGIGVFLISMGCMNYLIDSYTIYAVCVLADAVLRSICLSCRPKCTVVSDPLGLFNSCLHMAPLPAIPVLIPQVWRRRGGKCKCASQSDLYMKNLGGNLIDERKRKVNRQPSLRLSPKVLRWKWSVSRLATLRSRGPNCIATTIIRLFGFLVSATASSACSQR